MKIAVVCANGKAGKLIVKEAVSRGIDVTAVVRGDNQTEAKSVIKRICSISLPPTLRILTSSLTLSEHGRRTHSLSTAHR